MKIVNNVVLELDPKKVKTFKGQPRSTISEDSVSVMADSLESVGGQVQPALVIRLDPPIDGFTHELIGGERRLRACLEKGTLLRAIEIEVRDKDEQFKLALVSNISEEMAPLDIAEALAKVSGTSGMSQKKVAELCGKNQTWVWQHLQLLKLPKEVKGLISHKTSPDKRLGFSQALILLDVSNPQDQVKLADQIAKEQLTTTETRKVVAEAKVNSNSSFKMARVRRTEDFRTFSQFVQRTSERLTQMAKNMKKEELDSLLDGGSNSEIDSLIGELSGILENVLILKKVITLFVATRHKKKQS